MNADASFSRPPASPLVTAASLGLLAALTIGPLLLEPRPADFLPPYSSAMATGLGMALVLSLIGLALLVRARLDRPGEPRAAGNVVLFAALAGLMTLVHWIAVDIQPMPKEWQRELYVRVLNHDYDAPHNYRPLPYGFARLVERITHDATFACLSYRWFFTFWFVWAAHRLARWFLDPRRALLVIVLLVVLYPLSVLHYLGQLADPLSHTLFVLAFLYLLEDRPLALAAALALGVLAKETAVIVVPAYLACYWRRGWRAWLISAGLGAVCVGAFLAVRLPLGWRFSNNDINGTPALLVGTNLGFGEPVAPLSFPLWFNYFHPLLFVGTFVPVLAWHWRRIDPRLRALCLTLTPLILVSSACFGWLYESRNYMPLVPLFGIACGLALGRLRQRGPQPDRKECHKVGA